jgi:neutral ceramidase
MCKLPGLLLVMTALSSAADYKAGVARINITPTAPMYLSGYGNRNHPSDGKLTDLWARALAIEDGKGGRVVIVSTDLAGLPISITDAVSARAAKEYQLDRSQVMFNSSHTHTGPVLRRNLIKMFDLDAEQTQRVNDCSRELSDKLVTVIGAALGDLGPANLSFGNGSVAFAMNRRLPTPGGYKNSPYPAGPTDHDVPVLRVTAPDGKLRAVLFGYACHNTTLTAEFYQFSGDYAGYAQIELERDHPGATALFLMLCGGDQHPYPRSKLEYANKHGADLAAEVSRLLSGPMKPARGRIRTAFQTVALPLAIHTRETFESRLHDPSIARVRHAKWILESYDQGHPIRSYPYPAQAIAFGKDLTVVALGGEVVVDYVLRIKREYGGKGIIVAAYSNDVMSYIPSLRVLNEGGYEASDAMISYGLPGPYNEEVEDRVFAAIHSVMKRVGR